MKNPIFCSPSTYLAPNFCILCALLALLLMQPLQGLYAQSTITIALKAANGQYLCAENGGGIQIVANRDAKGPWETFTMEVLGNHQVALKAANGQYLCAENGGGIEILANRNARGPWETFTMEDLGNNQIALKAANGQYLCAENGGGIQVLANRNARGPWETFTLEYPGNIPITSKAQVTKISDGNKGWLDADRPVAWYAYVITANEWYAGTDANVWIRIKFDDGYDTGKVYLDTPNYNDFEAGDKKSYQVCTHSSNATFTAWMGLDGNGTAGAGWKLSMFGVSTNPDSVLAPFQIDGWFEDGTSTVGQK